MNNANPPASTTMKTATADLSFHVKCKEAMAESLDVALGRRDVALDRADTFALEQLFGDFGN